MTLIRHGQPVITRLSPHNANTRFIKSKTNQGGGGGEPIFLDTFTDTNGTALASHTPDVGGAWTDVTPGWEIQGNKAQSTTNLSISTMDAGESDVLLESIIQSDTPEASVGFILRYTNDSNYWFTLLRIQAIDPDDKLIRLFERNAGSNTVRASAAVTTAINTDYKTVFICDDETITGYVDDVNKITYGSATLNKTATVYGLRKSDTAYTDSHDNFAVYPRSG